MAKLEKDSLSHHQYQALKQAAAAKESFEVAIEPLVAEGFTKAFLEERFGEMFKPAEKKPAEKKPDPLK